MAKSERKRHRIGKKYYDYPLLFLVIFLIGFGLVMIFSTSSYKSTVNFGNPYYWVTRQAVFIAIGAFFALVLSHLDYRIFKSDILAWGSYFFGIILLAIVLVVGASKKGAVRWIAIGGFQFQPSEFAKIFMIIFLAYWISGKWKKLKSVKENLITLAMAMPIIGLVASQNLSTALVLIAIAGVMLFVASPRTRTLLTCAGAAAGVLMIYLLTANSYRSERLSIWLHPETHPKGLQTMQSLYAIGSGGLFGKGLGQSMQKMGFIPESHNDMIFSIICEELGLFGAVCLILVFVVLIWRMLLIALNAGDLFGSLLVIGFMTHIGAQVFINIAVVTNTIPPTGIPLPFISYGGSSIIAILIEMGLTLSVSSKIRMS